MNRKTVTVAGVPVTVQVISGDLVVSVGRLGTVTVVVNVADESGGTGRPGRRSYFDLYPDPEAAGSPPGKEAQQ